ncbi:MAG: hypothetical protein JWM11_4567 [Planctomycetaceae bacterium]|nr:hypothetical protein [Planctomycetaceae bacterium]
MTPRAECVRGRRRGHVDKDARQYDASPENVASLSREIPVKPHRQKNHTRSYSRQRFHGKPYLINLYDVHHFGVQLLKAFEIGVPLTESI